MGLQKLQIRTKLLLYFCSSYSLQLFPLEESNLYSSVALLVNEGRSYLTLSILDLSQPGYGWHPEPLFDSLY